MFSLDLEVKRLKQTNKNQTLPPKQRNKKAQQQTDFMKWLIRSHSPGDRRKEDAVAVSNVIS